jgi:hypothetical protein
MMDTASAKLNLLNVLNTFPATVVLVVDLATGQLTVLHGQSFTVSTIQEVVHLIRGVTAAQTRLVLTPATWLAPAGSTAPA